MTKSKIEPHRCFISSIDAGATFVDYNEYTLDPDGEIYDYILQLISYNYDNVASRKAVYDEDSFLAAIVPENADGFDAFVDVVADEMHDLLKQVAEMSPGSGLFVYATVDEQPVIAFFKLNYQTKFSCEKNSDGELTWTKDYRLLPSHTQKEYDYFFINVFENRVSMSDSKCMVDGQYVNYMAECILKISLRKSEKEVVKVIQDVMTNTIKECYEDEAPQKIFEYRRVVADTAREEGEINPKRIRDTVFSGNEKAMERYEQQAADLEINEQPVYVSPKTRRSLAKKQKITTKSGIELLVPVDLLSDKNVFSFKQENGMVSIVINDMSGEVK